MIYVHAVYLTNNQIAGLDKFNFTASDFSVTSMSNQDQKKKTGEQNRNAFPIQPKQETPGKSAFYQIENILKEMFSEHLGTDT